MINSNTIKNACHKSLYSVYHIHQTGCTSLDTGYIGITRQSLQHRLRQHMTSKRPVGVALRALGEQNVQIKCIARLPLDAALQLEYKLRPRPNMGWNVAVGGGVSKVRCTGCNATIPNSTYRKGTTLCFTCLPKRDSTFKKGMTPHNAGCTSFVLTDPDGRTYHVDNLTQFCKQHNLTRENIRKVARGERKHAKGWTAKFVNRVVPTN